jgi:hypothetical protein
MGINQNLHPTPISYLFGSKLNCYTDGNAVTESVLLVDFDHREYLTVFEIKSAQTLASLFLCFSQLYALPAVR